MFQFVLFICVHYLFHILSNVSFYLFAKIQPGVEVPHGGESLDHAGAWHGTNGKDIDLRERDLLLLRRAELAEGSERILFGLQQTRGSARHEPKPPSQLMKVLERHDTAS